MADNKRELVLVTGGSGFLGSWCIIKCLNANYRVRTTVRSLKREKDVREALTAGGISNFSDLSFVEADLAKDDGWSEAVKGCTYVLHVASPFPAAQPKNEDDLIVPAREGTLRTLRAARDAGVKRIVITSSFAAIGYGHTNWDYSIPFTEKNWTNVDSPSLIPYTKSKAIAERAAWDFIDREGGSLELSVVNPGLILGPLLSSDTSSSIEAVSRLMNGAIPACPRLSFTVVDVRDSADLHLLAMTDPKAKGERFLSVSPPAITMREMSLALHERLGKAAKRAPTRELPNFVVRLIAMVDPAVASVTGELGKVKEASNDKAKDLLGWRPRSNIDAIINTAESLINLGLVKS